MNLVHLLTSKLVVQLFAGEPLFDHVKLLKEKKIHVVPNIHSHQLL